MSTIEDRLTRALAARADQVQPEDLRPPEVPTATVTPLRRRPAAYAVAAAAVAAAVAAPFVVDLGGGDTSPTPPATQGPSPEPREPQPDVGGDWPVEFTTTPVDVDGDGVADRIRVRHEPGKPLVGPRARVEVDLSADGRTVFGLVETFGGFVNVADVVDLDGDGDRELTIYRDDADFTNGAETFAVLTLDEDRLVGVEVPDEPPLVTGTVPAGDGLGRTSRVWVDGGALRSYLSVDAFSGGEPLSLPTAYRVDVVRWSLEGDALVATSEGEQCIDVLDGPEVGGAFVPAPCADGGVAPALLPAADDTIGPGGSFDVPLGEVTYSVALEPAALVVDGPVGEQRVALSGGAAPSAYSTPVRMSDIDLSVLVAQGAGDSTQMTLVVVREGRLVAAETAGPVPFGSGVDVDGRRFETWIGPEGRLFTRRESAPGSEEYDVWSWALGGSVSIDAPPTLQPATEGCFTQVDDTLTPCR